MKKSLLIAALMATMGTPAFATTAIAMKLAEMPTASATATAEKAAPADAKAKAKAPAKKEKASKLYTEANRYSGGNDGYTLPNGESLGT